MDPGVFHHAHRDLDLVRGGEHRLDHFKLLLQPVEGLHLRLNRSIGLQGNPFHAGAELWVKYISAGDSRRAPWNQRSNVAPGQGTSTCAAPSSSLPSSCPSLAQSWCWWEWSAQKLVGRRSWTLESHLPAGWTTLLEVLGTYARAAKHCETLLELMCVVYFRDVFYGCVLLLWQQNKSRISRPQLCSSEVCALLTSISKLNIRQTDRFNGIHQVWNRSRCLCWLGRLNFTCRRRSHLQYICWEGRLSIKVWS